MGRICFGSLGAVMSDSAMEPEDRKAGRDRVRDLLVERVQSAGVRPARGRTQADHDALMKRLVERLAYMDADNLMTLAEAIIEQAGAAAHCPSEVAVLEWAEGLQARPFAEKRIVRSWLASREGPQAEAAGYLVELYRWLRQHGRPLMRWDMRQVRADAEENLRRAERLRGRDDLAPEDRHWLEARLRDERAARAIVRDGADRREAGAA